MIILKEISTRTDKARQKLEEELSEKLGDKVVILPMYLEVIKILHEPQIIEEVRLLDGEGICQEVLQKQRMVEV